MTVVRRAKPRGRRRRQSRRCTEGGTETTSKRPRARRAAASATVTNTQGHGRTAPAYARQLPPATSNFLNSGTSFFLRHGRRWTARRSKFPPQLLQMVLVKEGKPQRPSRPCSTTHQWPIGPVLLPGEGDRVTDGRTTPEHIGHPREWRSMGRGGRERGGQTGRVVGAFVLLRPCYQCSAGERPSHLQGGAIGLALHGCRTTAGRDERSKPGARLLAHPWR